MTGITPVLPFFMRSPARACTDVSRDDLRFLMIKQSTTTNEPATSARLILVQHWFEELKRRVPTN
jgi:hypothetical protein